ncbi:hypothetical protein HAX54_033068 [Datura stramonium]|uniref:Uncharacterized protein n=1 Tax=Datura stramonium TaxID=4076 RepID=A0ABS8VEC9_DATST|nr:hypothetical protein [Datura stramonium]
MKIDGECLTELDQRTRRCLGCATGSSGEVGIGRALILGGLLLRCFQQLSAPGTWLPSVYRGHDNWYTRVKLLQVLHSRANLRPARGNLFARLRYLLGGLCPIETVYLRLSLGSAGPGHKEYLALQGGPCRFTRDSTCPMLLGSERKLVMLSATGLSQSRVQHSGCRLAARRLYCSPTTPFSRLSLACPWIQQQFERLPHSGVSGSMLIFTSPKHFVDYYALISGCLGIHRKPFPSFEPRPFTFKAIHPKVLLNGWILSTSMNANIDRTAESEKLGAIIKRCIG